MQVRFYLSQYPEENEVIRALYDGCGEAKTLATLDQYEPSEVAVIMGMYKKNVPASFKRGHVFSEQRRQKLDCLVLETGYLNRGNGLSHHYALGWNGLNGRADFRNHDSPADRAAKLGIALEPRHYGANILLCGQVPWDASCDFINLQDWLLDAVEKIRSVSGANIVYRPHPMAKLPNMRGCQYSMGKPLIADLLDAHCVVTFNSNSAVEAVIKGVPVFSFDEGSMVWPICNKSWLDIENPKFPNRQQWLNNLAYSQWLPAEMRSGEAWHHICRTSRQPAPS